MNFEREFLDSLLDRHPQIPPTRSSRVSFASCELQFKSLASSRCWRQPGSCLPCSRHASRSWRRRYPPRGSSTPRRTRPGANAPRDAVASRVAADGARHLLAARLPSQFGPIQAPASVPPHAADPGLPGAPSSSPDGKGAALSPLECLRFDAVGSFLMSSPHRLLPSRRASRLDKPPERLILGSFQAITIDASRFLPPRSPRDRGVRQRPLCG